MAGDVISQAVSSDIAGGATAGQGVVPNERALQALETRRSVGQVFLSAPGPTPEQFQRLITIATRVPDHGKLEPWRMLVFSGDARLEAGQKLSAIYREEHHFMEPERLEKFAGAITRLFSYAPLVVLVISSPAVLAKIPVREQEASSAAVCMNLLNASHAMGFGTTWVTGWASESAGAAKFFGVDQHERVIGIIHIGTASERPADRPRPDLDRIVRYWTTDGVARDPIT